MVEAVAVLIALGTGTLGFFLMILMAVLASRHAIVDQRSTIGALAREFGLDVLGTDVLVGRYDDHDVHQYAFSDGVRGESTETRVVVRGGLPQGMSLDQRALWSSLGGLPVPGELALDRRLRGTVVVSADDAVATRDVLADPAVIETFLALWRDGIRTELKDDRVILVRRHVHAKGRRLALAGAVRLARALEQAVRGPWTRLAADRGLAVAPDGDLLSGRVDGIALTVRFVAADPGRTDVVATFHPALPLGSVLGPAGSGSVRLGDPVLDGMIGVATPEPEALAERIARDEVRGLVLEVVHGHPGSEVAGDTVRLAVPGRLRAELGAKVDLALALAGALARSGSTSG